MKYLRKHEIPSVVGSYSAISQKKSTNFAEAFSLLSENCLTERMRRHLELDLPKFFALSISAPLAEDISFQLTFRLTSYPTLSAFNMIYK